MQTQRDAARRDFLDEAVESWVRYQETGLHLTGEEVRDWLRGWESEAETEVPDCHN